MGQKVHPIGFRLGINKQWQSNWFAKKTYGELLHEDIFIRDYIKKQLFHAGVSKIGIERAANRVKINIHTARPGIIIGRKGSEVDRLKNELSNLTNKEIVLNIIEIRKAEVDSQLIAENIALQLEKRVSFRRAMKRSVTTALRFGVQGIKIRCAGRLGGAEMARTEWYKEGRVPLQTIRADIDYGFAISKTLYGVIGVKVWIFKGEVFSVKEDREEK